MPSQFKLLNETEKPREKAKRFGISSLSNVELIALIIKCGYKDKSVLEVSNDLINYFHSINGVINATYFELKNIKGISEAKALEISAIKEIFLRMNDSFNESIYSEEILISKYKVFFQSNEEESFVLILIDKKDKIIKEIVITKGLINGGLYPINKIIKLCLKNDAKKFYIFHNHINGIEPSLNDLKWTQILKKKCKEMNISLIRHLLFYNNFYSEISII